MIALARVTTADDLARRLELGLVLTVPDAARRCDVDRRTFWRWIRRGQVPVERWRVGRRVRTVVPVAALEAAPVPVGRGRRSPLWGRGQRPGAAQRA